MAKKETIPTIIDTPEALTANERGTEDLCYLHTGAGRQDL